MTAGRSIDRIFRFTATRMHSDAAVSVTLSLISRGDARPGILSWGSSKCKGPDTEAWMRRDKEPYKRGELQRDRLRSRTQRQPDWRVIVVALQVRLLQAQQLRLRIQ
jgi:hypothetical protein